MALVSQHAVLDTLPAESAMKYADAMIQARRLYWRDLMHETGGNVTKAAELAGVNRTWLHGMLVKLGLRKKRTYTRDA